LRVYSGRRVRDAPLLARLGTRLARARRPARGVWPGPGPACPQSPAARTHGLPPGYRVFPNGIDK